MLTTEKKIELSATLKAEIGETYKNNTKVRRNSTKQVLSNEEFVKSILNNLELPSSDYDEAKVMFDTIIIERQQKLKANAVVVESDKTEKRMFNESVLDEIIADPLFPYTFNEETADWERKQVATINTDDIESNELRQDDTLDDIVAEIFRFIRNNNKAITCFEAKDVMTIIHGKIDKCIRAKFAQAMSVIRFNPDNVAYLDEKLKVVYDYFEVKEPYDVFTSVMKHWMANVKRATYQGGVREWHQWVNWFGGQGIGKTHFVNAFTAPYDLARVNVQRISDLVKTDSNAWIWSNKIITSDELGFKTDVNDDSKAGGLKAEETNVLKSILTGPYILMRRFFENGKYSQQKVPNNASLMSTANQHLFEVISDEAGMRRFVEFTCRCKKHPKEDWAIIDGIDFAKMWSGINPNLRYFEYDSVVGKKLERIQSTYIKMPKTVISWVTDVFNDPNSWCTIPFGDVEKEYEAYCEWMARNHKNSRNIASLVTLRNVLKRRYLTSILALGEPTEDNVVRAVNRLKTNLTNLSENDEQILAELDIEGGETQIATLIRDLFVEQNGEDKFKSLFESDDDLPF